MLHSIFWSLHLATVAGMFTVVAVAVAVAAATAAVHLPLPAAHLAEPGSFPAGANLGRR